MVREIRIPTTASEDERGRLMLTASAIYVTWKDHGMTPTVTVVTAGGYDVIVIEATTFTAPPVEAAA